MTDEQKLQEVKEQVACIIYNIEFDLEITQERWHEWGWVHYGSTRYVSSGMGESHTK